MKGCLLFAVAIAFGLALGLVVTATLELVTGDLNLSSIIGTGVWLLSTFTILAYGGLWLGDSDDFRHPAVGWRAQRRESKLRTAEIRMGFAFGMIGGALAWHAKGPMAVTVLVTAACAILGGLIGYDVKRRVRRIREALTELDNSRLNAEIPQSQSGDESPHSKA